MFIRKKSARNLILLSVFIAALSVSNDTLGNYSLHKISRPESKTVPAMLDTLVPSILNQYQLPGAVIGIIHKDSVLYLNGFGYANIKEKRRVDTDSTLFRLASISKTFTAIAVLQLVEQGKIDLYKDVNNYLPPDIQLKSTFRKPVTLFNLLTHTAGLDDRYISKTSKTPYEPNYLKNYLRGHMPQRVYPPGLLYSYSNYGIALAGYIVERQSGQSFADYLKQNVLETLGMSMSSLKPDSVSLVNRAVGYHNDSGHPYEISYDYILDSPAGQINATGSDMVRYMQALINNGANKHGRVLDSASVAYMQHTRFTHHPKLQGGVGMTFHIGKEHNRRTVSHSGGYMGTRTRMTLIPAMNTGWFIAFNQLDSRPIDQLQNLLFDELLKKQKIMASPKSGDQTESNYIDVPIDHYTGTYRETRYPRNTIDKVAVLSGAVGSEMKLTSKGDTLIMPLYGPGTRQLLPVDPRLFKSLDDDYYLAFGRDRDRNISFAYTSGTSSLEKIPWYYTTSTQRKIIVGGVLIQLLMLLGWLGGAIIRRAKERNVPQEGRQLRISARTGSLILFTHLIGLIIIFLGILPRHELMAGIPYGLPDLIYPVQIIGYLGIAATALGVGYLIIVWLRSQMHWGIRLLYSLALLGTITYIWALNYWNLVGFSF